MSISLSLSVHMQKNSQVTMFKHDVSCIEALVKHLSTLFCRLRPPNPAFVPYSHTVCGTWGWFEGEGPCGPFYFLNVSRLAAFSRSSSEGLSQQADAVAALKKRVYV